MASCNLVVLVGNLTRDVELKQVSSGPVANFSLAINERVKQGDAWINKATFVDVAAFGRTAELVAEYLRKGSLALVSGRLRASEWQTQAGEKRRKLEVVAERVEFLSPRDASPPSDAAPAGGYEELVRGVMGPEIRIGEDPSDAGIPF